MEIMNPDINGYERIMRFLKNVYGFISSRYPDGYIVKKTDYKNIIIIEKGGKNEEKY